MTELLPHERYERLEKETRINSLPSKWEHCYNQISLWCLFASDMDANVEKPQFDRFVPWLVEFGFTHVESETICQIARDYLGDLADDH